MRAHLGPLTLASLLATTAACLSRPEPVSGPARSLGTPCVVATDCPGGHECLRLAGIGSQTDGFCTIACAPGDAAICADGFAGPGTPLCSSEQCVIACGAPGAAGQCPAGLVCVEAQGQGWCVRPP